MKRLGIKACGLLFQECDWQEHKRNRVVPQGRRRLNANFENREAMHMVV